jgi:energy-coupling factor transport system permease protein
VDQTENSKFEDPKGASDLTKKVQKIASKNKAKHSHKQFRLTQFLNDTILTEGPKIWLERLNPISKLFCLILFTVMLFFQSSLILLSCFFIGEFLIAFCSHLDIRALLRQMRWLIILTLVYIPLNGIFNASVFTEETILFYLWDPYFPVRRIAFYYALRTGLIIMILFSSTIIFNSTTSFKALVYSLIQMKIPYRYAFAFMIGLRYVPIIQHETSVIEIAQELRGFGLHRKNRFVKIFEMLGHRITTLLISIFRKAHNTALSIESRGFGLHSGRTNLTKINFTRRDLLIPLSIILVFVILLMYNSGLLQLPAIPSLLSLIAPLI